MNSISTLATNSARSRKPSAKRKLRRRFLKWLLLSLSILLILGCAGLAATWFLLQENTAEAESLPALSELQFGKERFLLDNLSAKDADRLSKKLQQRNDFLRRELDKLYPREPYLLIDTATNRLYMKKGEEVLREAICSTGSGRILLYAQSKKKKRQWTFDTPRGEFRIQDKKKYPVWRKPDWAFLEEGEPVPKNEADRIETGTLGDYALAFGNGFFIHGTLYTRLLGRSVTHGCVRLGDEDLKYIYKNTEIGARLFIF